MLRTRFEYAENSPAPSAPKKKYIEWMKEKAGRRCQTYHRQTNLKDMKLPEDRRGGLRDVINGVTTGKYSNDWIISKLKTQVQEMRVACLDGDPFKTPCYPEFAFGNRDLGGYL